MSVSRPCLGVRSAQVIAQNYGSGDVIKSLLLLASGSLLSAAARWRAGVVRLNSLFGFPGAQPLVHHLNGNAQCFFDSYSKGFRLRGHITFPAVQVQGQSDHNAAHGMLSNQIAQTREIAAPIDSRPDRKWAGRQALLVRESEPKALLSVIDGEDYTRAGVIRSTRRSPKR
jgi:hypothetical protein